MSVKDYGKSIECDNCGELVSGNKINELNNEQLCISCFEKSKS
jgi:formylmethanofuran dehydrogenase subunit E